jgi:hypothetical protein
VIKGLLQKPDLPASQEWSSNDRSLQIPHSSTIGPRPLFSENTSTTSKEPVQWDHSAQVSDFVRTVTEDRASREDPGTDEGDVLSSLRRLARALDNSNVVRDLSFPETRGAESQGDLSMPPAEAAVLCLRWAKGRSTYSRCS